MKVALNYQASTNCYNATITVNTEELSHDGRSGKILSQSDGELAFNRKHHDNAVSRGINCCYREYRSAVTDGKNPLECNALLPVGNLMISTPENTKLSDIAHRSGSQWILNDDATAHLLSVDGGHRVRLAAKVGEEIGHFTFPIYCQFYQGLNEQQMAELFLKACQCTNMSLAEKVNAAIYAGHLNSVIKKIDDAFARGLGDYTDQSGKTVRLLIKPKFNSACNGVLTGRFLTWISYGMTNNTSVNTIMKNAGEFSQLAYDNVIKLMAIFAEEVGYFGDAHNKKKTKHLSANVFQSVMARVVLNHPMTKKPPTIPSLTENEYRTFFRYIADDNDKGYELLRTIEMLSSAGGSGRKKLYDLFTAKGDEERTMRSLFAYRKDGRGYRYFKCFPKFATNVNPDMLEHGDKSDLYDATCGEDKSEAGISESDDE
jgi:hypothetical protein